MADRSFTSQFQFSFEKQMVSLPAAFSITEQVAAHLTNQGVTYTAVTAGSSGNDITIRLIDRGDATGALSIAVVGSAISATLQSTASVAARLINQGVTYTANSTGTGGNSITIALLDPAANNSPLSVSVVGNAISIHLATDSGGLITSTAAQVIAAVNASSPAHALVTASGSGSSALTALGATNLAGGAAAAIVTTAAALISALNADVSASALIVASGSGSSPLTALSATHLAGGVDFSSTNNLPIAFMSLSRVAAGQYRLTLADKYRNLLSAQFMLQKSSALDLFPQLISESVNSAKTIDFRTFAIGSGSPVETAIPTGSVLYVDLKLRNVT